jgi:hypothetical protein
MRTPERSSAIARALAAEQDGLPKDFATQVARLAEAAAEARSSKRNEVALGLAFVAMIGVCVVGWLTLGASESVGSQWLASILRLAASQPLLTIGIAGVALIQVLIYRRRAASQSFDAH